LPRESIDSTPWTFAEAKPLSGRSVPNDFYDWSVRSQMWTVKDILTRSPKPLDYNRNSLVYSGSKPPSHK
jgi:hypothetical protein